VLAAAAVVSLWFAREAWRQQEAATASPVRSRLAAAQAFAEANDAAGAAGHLERIPPAARG
jgi:hypothetical protein